MGIVDAGVDSSGRPLVLARGLPGNEILIGYRDDYDAVKSLKVLLSQSANSTTHRCLPVWGYEDPTYVPASLNAWEPGKPGVLCSQTYHTGKDIGHPDWPDCCLVYFGIEGSTAPRPILTDEMIEAAGLTENCSLVKEPELFFDDNRLYMFFEYSDVATQPLTSNVGVCRVEADGTTADIHSLLTAEAVKAEHVSPVSYPVRLPGNQLMLFLNRGYWGPPMRWGVTSCSISSKFPFEIDEISDEWLVSPPPAWQMSADSAFIAVAFASQITRDKERFDIYYHLHDCEPRIARFQLTEGLV